MAEKRYGFIRCSTDKQNEARQLKALRDFGIPDEDIIIEKESGKIRGAERELVEKERRTRAGIEIAKSEGKYKGRKPIEYDVRQIEQCYSRWKSGVIKTSEFRKLLGLKPNTFYRAIEKYEKTCDQGQKARRTELPQAAEGRSA